jgi:RimJ/RimL family protein N-acetyltransferase
VRTPRNPTFWWGNFLLYDRAPQPGDAAAWLAAFDAEITQVQPGSGHLAFGIDVPERFELPADFAAAGLELLTQSVLTLTRDQLQAPPKAIDHGFSVRAAELPARIGALVDLQVASDEGGHEPAGYRVFREQQMRRYTAMQDAGLGHVFAVFTRMPHGERPVADCGLFRDGRGPGSVARFQHVETHPQWRRRGLCSALVHRVCRHAFEVTGVETLVMVADPDDVAIGIYEALGFQRGADVYELQRRPAAERAQEAA